MSLDVHHFGPDPATVGGMASVIRVLVEHAGGGDVVESHSTWTPRSQVATARLLPACLHALRRIPAGQVAHVHLSERGSFLREGGFVAMAHHRGLVTVVTIHGAAFVPFAHAHPMLVSTVLRRADLVTCMTPEVRDLVRARAPDVRTEIVPNPVLLADTFLPADATEEIVLFAGEIGMRKGADVLCRAWRRVVERRPAARCIMVGPSSDFAPPRVERLEVRASADPVAMRELMRRARVIALPSRAEGMPMVLTEAMSEGRPFVATPVGAIPELAAGGGVLVPVNDDAALADRLTELLSNPDLARTIGERGREFCVRTRSIEVVGARLRELYSEATAARFSTR